MTNLRLFGCVVLLCLVGCADDGQSANSSASTARQRSGNSSYVSAAGGGNLSSPPMNVSRAGGLH